MGTTDNNGIYFYEDTDAVSPLHTLLNAGQQSVSNALNANPRIWSVTNVAARDALLTARGASPASPLITYRRDKSSIERHDGSGWLKIAGPREALRFDNDSFWQGVNLGSATGVNIFSTSLVTDAAAWVEFYVPLNVRTDPGNTILFAEVVIDNVIVRSRRCESNSVLTMDCSVFESRLVAAGTHAVQVRLTAAVPGPNFRVNSAMFTATW